MKQLSQTTRRIPLLSRVLVSGVALAAVLLGGQPWAGAEAVIQAYGSDQPLERGRVVALDEKDSSKIVLAPADNLRRMHGVVVDPNDAPVTLTRAGQEVFVASSGRYQVLVTTVNGLISAGDYLSMSNIAGIAAKATEKQEYALGKALESFDGQANAINLEGGRVVGRIIVDIQIGKNPIAKTDRNFLPEFLRKAGESIAGKPVSNARLYSAIGVLLAAAGIAGALIFAGVRNAMISIGRNPLGKASIYRGMVQVVIFSITIFIIGILGVYLLLKI